MSAALQMEILDSMPVCCYLIRQQQGETDTVSQEILQISFPSCDMLCSEANPSNSSSVQLTGIASAEQHLIISLHSICPAV